MRAHNLPDVGDGICNAQICGCGLVGIIRGAVGCHSDVLQQGVRANGIPGVRLTVSGEIENPGAAAPFQVEEAVIIPAVLVIANQQALGVTRQSGLAGSGQAEKESGISSVQKVLAAQCIAAMPLRGR